MAGGMFSEDTEVNIPGVNPTPEGQTTSNKSPGGMFAEDGQDVVASKSAASSAEQAEEYAKDAQGWAVGTDTEALNDWSDTNNAKYYSEQADSDASAAAASASSASSSASDAANSATAAASSATSAASSAAEADSDRILAQEAADRADSEASNAASSASEAATSASEASSSADEAAASATAADADATAAAASAASADSDATAAASSAASADSDRIIAESAAASADSDRILAAASAASADSDAIQAESWAVGGTGARPGEDTDNSKYWSEQAESHAGNVRTDSEGYGILLDTGTPNKQVISVDTEVIADTEWVKTHVNTNGGNVTWEDQRSDTEFVASTLEVNSSTGLEIVMVGTKAVLREYVPTPDFAISISGGQPNASWFMANTTDTVSISAQQGTLTSITSANVGGSSTDVTINNNNDTITYPVSNANGLYTLNVSASGTNADSVSQTDSASHTWRIYADYWLATNQASASAAFSNTAGRSSGRFTTGDITAQGYTFLTVSKTEFPTKFQFRTSLGGLDVQDPTTITVTINGINKEYFRYYLGNFSHETTITVSGG